MTLIKRFAFVASTLLLLSACASLKGSDDVSTRSDDAAVKKTLQQSFTGNQMAPLTRLDQNKAQKACSDAAASGKALPAKLKAELEKAAFDAIAYPANGQYLGNWKKGQKLASRGKGMTWRDKPGSQNYGNCYACHQLETAQVSYGNIGPSLNNYGKSRGNTPEMLKYTWGRLWNSHAFNACNAMPRFGAAGILKESELKDLMALLHDAESPVNK